MAMGGRQRRRKGHDFERKIATTLRERWPDAIVQRASQSNRAFQSDVFITGGARLLERLWIEAQDTYLPTPMAKLEQAERDCAGVETPGARHLGRLPIAVTHKTAARAIHVTMRMSTFDEIRGLQPSPDGDGHVPLTIDFGEFLDLVAKYANRVPRESAATQLDPELHGAAREVAASIATRRRA